MDRVAEIEPFEFYQSRNGESLLVTFQEEMANIFSVSIGEEYKNVNIRDVAELLRNRSPKELELLLPKSSIVWSPNREPSIQLKPELTAGQLLTRLRDSSGLVQFFDDLDHLLLQVQTAEPPLCSKMFSVLGFIEDPNEKAQDVKGKIEAIFRAFADIQELKSQPQHDSRYQISAEAARIVRNLVDWGLIRDLNDSGFLFSKDAFDRIASCYGEADQQGVLCSIKYLILTLMDQYLDQYQCSESIIAHFENLIDEAPPSAKAIQAACCVRAGKLCIASNRVQMALGLFGRVPEESEFYPGVQKSIEILKPRIKRT